ncbi:MAG TPA: hypothetical protein VF707_05370 [Ardenticatenaceae bacterium]
MATLHPPRPKEAEGEGVVAPRDAPNRRIVPACHAPHDGCAGQAQRFEDGGGV